MPNPNDVALKAIHEFLGIAQKKICPQPDKPESDWAKLKAAVDGLALLAASQFSAVVLDDERAAFELKSFEAALWALVEQARSWEKAYSNPSELYEALDAYKGNVERELHYLVSLHRTQLEREKSTLRQFRQFASAASPKPVAQTERALTDAPQFDAKHVSLKERPDGKLVLTLLLDGVEGAPRYKVMPVNPGVVRTAAQPASVASND
jgi:hypothetical protein